MEAHCHTPLVRSEGVELSAAQRQVVDHAEGPLRVRGRAGTGKTTALVARYLRLASEVAPSGILFLCRSRESVAAIRDAVLPQLAGGFDALPIATFHAVAVDVLARGGDWPRRLSVAEQRMLVRELLTDRPVDEINQLSDAQKTHPMQAKKDLAARVVADFHSPEAAAKASEDWAKQSKFQKDDLPEGIEEVRVSYVDVCFDADNPEDIAVSTDGIVGFQSPTWGVRLDRLLVKCGLADSVADAGRKLKAGSVKVVDQSVSGLEYVEAKPHILVTFQGSSTRLVLKVGKRVKTAVIER